MAASIFFKPPYATGPVPSLSDHAIAYRWRSLPRVRRHRASKPQGSSERVLPWQVTMDQLIFASLSHTHHWYEVGMLKMQQCHRPLNNNQGETYGYTCTLIIILLLYCHHHAAVTREQGQEDIREFILSLVLGTQVRAIFPIKNVRTYNSVQ